MTCGKWPPSPPTLGGFLQNVPRSQIPSLGGLFCGDHATPVPAGHTPPFLRLLQGRIKQSPPALPRTAQTHSLHRPRCREARPLGRNFGPGWRRRVSRAALRDRSSCCLWSVLSRQYLRSSTAGRESGKSAEGHQALHTHASTHALCTPARTQVGRAPRLSSLSSAQLHCGTPARGSRSPVHPPKATTPHGAEGQRRDMKLGGRAWTPRSTVRCPVTPALTQTLSWGSPR